MKYTQQQKQDAADARHLLEAAIQKLPNSYIRPISNIISDIGQEIFKGEPFGDPIYDAWKAANVSPTPALPEDRVLIEGQEPNPPRI
jgi:hypothetical protein